MFLFFNLIYFIIIIIISIYLSVWMEALDGVDGGFGAASQVVYWLSITMSRKVRIWTRVGIPQQAFSGLIVIGTVNIRCTKQSGAYLFIYFFISILLLFP